MELPRGITQQCLWLILTLCLHDWIWEGNCGWDSLDWKSIWSERWNGPSPLHLLSFHSPVNKWNAHHSQEVQYKSVQSHPMSDKCNFVKTLFSLAAAALMIPWEKHSFVSCILFVLKYICFKEGSDVAAPRTQGQGREVSKGSTLGDEVHPLSHAILTDLDALTATVWLSGGNCVKVCTSDS